jgi:predicted ATP-grasp superfamily ATP-dependent carboligase
MNKKLFHEFAVQNDFDVPKTLFVHGEKDIHRVGYTTSYPCLIKPAYHEKNWENHVSKIDKILHVKSRNEYFNFFRNYNLSNDPLIVQEWIEGSDEDVFYCLAYINRKKEPAALFTGKKIRQYPVLTGSTSVAEGKRNAHVSEQSEKLLKTAGCIGICSVEFKYSKKDDVYYITEPTVGRTDTQEGSGIDAGMDIPYIAYLDALGYDHEPVMYFREGIKWINEPEDYNSVSMYLKRRGMSIGELIASYRGKRTYALSAIDDPLPFITFLCQKVKSRIFRNNYNPN